MIVREDSRKTWMDVPPDDMLAFLKAQRAPAKVEHGLVRRTGNGHGGMIAYGRVKMQS